jgi:hypothetical protein
MHENSSLPGVNLARRGNLICEESISFGLVQVVDAHATVTCVKFFRSKAIT